MKYWVVVPAAGIGSRFNSTLPKQYSLLLGLTVIEHSLKRLLRLPCEALVVAIHPEDRRWSTLEISGHPLIRSVVGGSERSESVLNALRTIAPEADDQDWVLVHDVVRPCITQADLQKLISGLVDSPVGGLLASPVKDTLKRVASMACGSLKPSVDSPGDGVNPEPAVAGLVTETVDRQNLWLAATPQMFRYGPLRKAIQACLDQGITSTDEAAAMELAGHQPTVIDGRGDNIKITHAEDLSLAEAILQAQAALQSECLVSDQNVEVAR